MAVTLTDWFHISPGGAAPRQDEEMARFPRWVRKRPAEYLDWPKDRRRE